MSFGQSSSSTLENDFADDFAYHTGRRIYLNNASVSLMPRSSIDAMTDFWLKYNSMGPDSELADELVAKKIRSVRGMLSALISCQPDEIVLTNSTTDGINMVASGLGALGPESNVIVRGMAHEHHANLYPWLRLQDRGVSIRDLCIRSDGLFDMAQLKSFIDNNTRLVVLSHALYNTGAILPVSDVGDIVHGASHDGCQLFIDAAQTVGCLDAADCDVSRIKCDYMSFNGSKWLCGPMGMGLFYCSKDAEQMLNPAAIGGESAVLCRDKDEDEDDADYSKTGLHYSKNGAVGQGMSIDQGGARPVFKDAPDKFQTGFRNYAGVVGLEASLKYLKGVGFEKIRSKNRNLSSVLQDDLCHMSNVSTYMPENPEERTSIISFNIEGMSPRDVVKRLARQGIILAVREMDRLEMVRASPHFFNTEAQMHELADRLKHL